MNKVSSLLNQPNIQSVKIYRIDVLLAVVFFLGGVFFAQKPGTDASMRQTKETVGKPAPKPVVKKEAPQPTETTAALLPTPYKKLDERNIFSSSGGYEVTKDLMRIPENPYTLIAILHGSEKRIVIKEFTGDLVSVKEGGALIDGAIVKKIGDSVVTLEKGGQTRELKILDYKELAVRKPVLTAPPRSQPGGGGNAATTQRGR